MGDQSKELTIEEIQLWWEINDSDIVTVPEKRECDTTVPQQQPLLNTTNEVEGTPGTPVNAFNAAGFPTTSSESQPDLDIPTYDMMLTMAVDVKNLVLNTKETNHYNVEMINKINNCLERFTPAVKTQAELDKSDYVALERKYTEEKASWKHTEELLRNIIRKKAKMEKLWQYQAQLANELAGNTLERSEEKQLKYLALMRRFREIQRQNSDLRFELASYEGEFQPSDEEPDVDNPQNEDNSQDD